MPNLVLHQRLHLPLPPLSSAHHFHPTISSCSIFQRKSMEMKTSINKLLPTRRNPRIMCMANPRRVKMVAKQILREISDMLITDNVLQYAILPEAALGADRYLSSLTTVSDVEISSDLQVAKVYISVFGDERGREVAIAGLKSKAKYVRSELGRRMKLRVTPEVRFIEDESLERGSRVIAILDKIKNEKNTVEGEVEDEDEDVDEENSDSSDLPKDDEDYDEDDPDEGIIYVD